MTPGNKHCHRAQSKCQKEIHMFSVAPVFNYGKEDLMQTLS